MKHHAILLRAPRELDTTLSLRAAATAGAPAILQRNDEDFIAATLESLRSEASRRALASSLAAVRVSGVLKLFQPVQREFHVVVLEAACATAGTPRLDPSRIESAGLVVRRIRPGAASREGWMRAGGSLRGWIDIGERAETDARHDPLPANRLAGNAIGPPALRRQLTAFAAERPGALLAEHTVPLFVAPPDVCSAAGRTFIYGVIPTVSSELADAPAPGPQGFGAGTEAFTQHLAGPLRGIALTLPRAGQAVAPSWRTDGDIPPNSSGHNPSLYVFVQMLRQLAIEFDVFGDSATSRATFAELQNISLPLVLRTGEITPRRVRAGDFLLACAAVLLERDESAPRPEMPQFWPALDSITSGRLAGALSAALVERFRSIHGRTGRYDLTAARYQVRAFVRLRPDGECPARTVWSEYSEPFTIAPWYEGAGAPPVQVQLPDATNRAFLKSLKPNVAFVVPPSLNNLLAGDLKKLADGDGKASDSPALQWICSFNLPVITICAFIVLNIFLSLFDLIFRWMLFIKICIPFPKIGNGNS
jgi:hypothetical protein